jgi:hypothetical protein
MSHEIHPNLQSQVYQTMLIVSMSNLRGFGLFTYLRGHCGVHTVYPDNKQFSVDNIYGNTESDIYEIKNFRHDLGN